MLYDPTYAPLAASEFTLTEKTLLEPLTTATGTKSFEAARRIMNTITDTSAFLNRNGIGLNGFRIGLSAFKLHDVTRIFVVKLEVWEFRFVSLT